MSGPIDTDIRLATCHRCGTYVFLAHSSGVGTAADPAPATQDAYIQALVGGRRTFWLMTQAGRPHRLLTRRPQSTAPTFDPGGAQTGTQGREVLVEHGCGGHTLDMNTFTEVAQSPPPARVTPGRHTGGPHQPAAPGFHIDWSKVGEPPSPAKPATPHPSSPYPRCGVCRRNIKHGEIYIGIQHGPIWIWAEHYEACD